MVDLPSVLIGIAVVAVPIILYFLKKLSVFGIKQWWFGKQNKKEWYDTVERTANGIQQAWNYSGFRPNEADKKRTAEEMDKYTDQLKEHRTHQNATEEMREVMNDIIGFWDRSRSLVTSKGRNRPYYDRGEQIKDDADNLKELLDWERKGRLRKFITTIPSKIRDRIIRVQKWRYQRQNKLLPYEIYREICTYLSENQIDQFTNGDVFLYVEREYGTEAVFLEKSDDGDEDYKYNIFQIEGNGEGGITVVDKLSGKSVSDGMLYRRLQEIKSLDTISYDEVVPDGKSIGEFEYE